MFLKVIFYSLFLCCSFSFTFKTKKTKVAHVTLGPGRHIRSQWNTTLDHGGVDQGARKGVEAVSDPTYLPAVQQLDVDLVSLPQRQQYRLGTAVFWVVSVVFPGGRHHLPVSHELNLVVHPLTSPAHLRVDREGEGIESGTRSCECTCKKLWNCLVSDASGDVS